MILIKEQQKSEQSSLQNSFSVRPHLTFTACIGHCADQFFNEFVSVLWIQPLLSTQLLDQSHTFLKRSEHIVHWHIRDLHTIRFYPESVMSSSIQYLPGLHSLCCAAIGWDSLWGHFYSSDWSVWQNISGISLTNRHHSQQNDSMSCLRDSSWHVTPCDCIPLVLYNCYQLTLVSNHSIASTQHVPVLCNYSTL